MWLLRTRKKKTHKRSYVRRAEGRFGKYVKVGRGKHGWKETVKRWKGGI
jgi:hypothetical protein